MSALAQHLVAAQGYLELGMFEAAAEELEEIEPESRDLPDVLAFRFAIYSNLDKWAMAEVVARHMVKLFPDDPAWRVDLAYATRRCRSLEEAWQILLDAEKQHPQEAVIQFNLGCYACKMGNQEEAKRRVATAIALDGKFRKEALDDPDLEPLWDEIARGHPVGDASAENT